MPFAASEASYEEGRPVFLLKFARPGKSWYYTNADRNITFDSQVYTAHAISFTQISQSGDAKSDDFSITMPASATICVYLDAVTPSVGIVVTLRKVHMVETDTDGSFAVPVDVADAPVVWVGEYVGLKRATLGSRIINCNTLSLSLVRGGLRLTWSRTCPHMLYDKQCKVVKATKAVPLTGVSVIDGVTLAAAEFGTLGPAYFDGGFIEWESEAGVVEYTAIETESTGEALLFGSTQGMSTGTDFVAYPGCNRSAEECNTKFSNILNFGGINKLQSKSPFDGNPVF